VHTQIAAVARDIWSDSVLPRAKQSSTPAMMDNGTNDASR